MNVEKELRKYRESNVKFDQEFGQELSQLIDDLRQNRISRRMYNDLVYDVIELAKVHVASTKLSTKINVDKIIKISIALGKLAI